MHPATKDLSIAHAAIDLAENARQHVHAHYSAERMAEEYFDLFKELITN